jgi:poly-beta-1,6-N-acetyl-D-glucosamine synthase
VSRTTAQDDDCTRGSGVLGLALNQQQWLLAFSAAAVFYTWVGYPLTLWMLTRTSSRATRKTQRSLPSVSIIVAAYNEAAQIATKLDDCLALDYQPDKMEILVVSDGSTDATEDIAQLYAESDSRIRLLRTRGRAGKSEAQNLAVRNATGEILLFTDAGARMHRDSLLHIASCFADPSVGMVAPVVYFGQHAGAVSRSQSAYWRFETWLRQRESRLGILATASGAAFAMRGELFHEIDAHYGDDCILPLDMCLAGFRVVQQPEARVYDDMPHTIAGELRTRVRMTARSCAGTLSRWRLLNPARFPTIAWGLFSHKLLRWMTPFFLSAAFVANALLIDRRPFLTVFLLQCWFYLAALAGWQLSTRRSAGPILGYPFAFCLANLGFLLGTLRCIRGTRVVAYK